MLKSQTPTEALDPMKLVRVAQDPIAIATIPKHVMRQKCLLHKCEMLLLALDCNNFLLLYASGLELWQTLLH